MLRQAIIVALLAIAAGAATATALPADPFFETPVRLHVVYGLIAVAGGIVRWHAKHSTAPDRTRRRQALLGDMMTSSFAGLLAYLACVRSGLSISETGLLVGVAGLMGARFIALVVNRVDQLLARVGLGPAPSAAMPLDESIPAPPPTATHNRRKGERQ